MSISAIINFYENQYASRSYLFVSKCKIIDFKFVYLNIKTYTKIATKSKLCLHD